MLQPFFILHFCSAILLSQQEERSRRNGVPYPLYLLKSLYAWMPYFPTMKQTMAPVKFTFNLKTHCSMHCFWKDGNWNFARKGLFNISVICRLMYKLIEVMELHDPLQESFDQYLF